METIDLGNKGFIIGGDMTAVHGVRAGNIGKEGGKSTKLHCGIDFIVQQQLETANGQLQLLTVKAEKIHCLLRRPDITQDKRLALDKLLKNIQEEQGKLRERIISLLERTNADESAIVEAYGEIAPGTLVEICQVALFVFQPLRKVRIKLDRFSGKLITEPLGKG
jgi:hypothetical protein